MLTTFVAGLAGALLFGYVAHRLKLSPIIGYLLAGVVVGPFTPGFVADRAQAEQLSEIGVILMLFGIGLRFRMRDLLAVWRIAVPGALIQSSISTASLTLLLSLLGWDWTPALITGMAVSVSSTVVMAMVLGEQRDLHTNIGHVAFGWTVLEDMITVAILLILPIAFAGSGAEGGGPAAALGLAALRVAGLAASILALGRWVIPWALERIGRTRSRELFTLSVIVIAVGVAAGSAGFFGVSMALGSFLAGLAVGRSEFATRAAGDAVPMRDAFAVLFFVSVGMLFDPASLIRSPLLVAVVLAVVLVGKPLTAALTVTILGKPLSTALPVGAALSQVGEFTFILGAVARDMGLLNDAGWNALVAAAIVSISLNPSIYRITRRFSSSAGAIAAPSDGPKPVVDPNRCILLGYGPVGRIVQKLLAERGEEVTVIDLNLDTVRALRANGIKAVYGDVLRPGALEEAGIATAGSLVLSADVEDAAEIIRQARRLNPEMRILARCSHLRDAAGLRAAGAAVVAAGEAEVGVALAEAVTALDGMGHGEAAEHREEIRARLYGTGAEPPRG